MTELIQITPPEKEPSSLRLIGTLSVAGFLSGLILVSAYVLTKPIIERNKEEALRSAIYHVLPKCATYDELILRSGKLIQPSAETPKTEPRVFVGYDSTRRIVGFAIPASESGFQDLIRLIYGYEASRKMIIGFEVLDTKETPGLGDKIKKDPKFIANFTALSVEPGIQGVKPGAKTMPHQVETITGATISSNAVIRALQKSLDAWRPAMESYVREGAQP